MNELVRMILTLVIVSVLSAASLAIVYEKARPIIEGKKLEYLENALVEVIPAADRFEENNDLKEIISQDREGIRQVFAAYNKNNEKIAMALLIDSIGFGGTIKILMGIDIDTGKITGMKILEHLETPGLGERITETEFLSQFKDKSTEIKTDEVDAITGATISSKAVIKTIAENVNKISGYIAKEAYEATSIDEPSIVNSSLTPNIENAST